MIDYITVGKKLKNLRLAKKLTQSELANELGVSIGYISQVESGDKCFNLDRLQEISKILDKPVGYFISGTDTDFRLAAIEEIVDIMGRLSEEESEKAKRIFDIIME